MKNRPMKHRHHRLFDVEERAAQLTKMGDPLVGLKARIDWEAFRPELKRVHEKDRKSQAGAKPFDVLLMLKILSHHLFCRIGFRGSLERCIGGLSGHHALCVRQCAPGSWPRSII
jgi:hypothetical protein